MNAELRSRIRGRLERLYGEEAAARLLPRVARLCWDYRAVMPGGTPGWSQRDALLIAYGDSLLGNGPPLQVLHRFLRRHAGDAVTFLHLLPFFPFTSDDGFSVEDFREVRPDLGSWEDVRELASAFRLVVDGVLNHVSASSRYVRGYLTGDPRFEDFVIALPPDTDTSAVLRTRDLPLLHPFETAGGETRHLWTTFSADQVDLNFRNPEVLMEILDVLLLYARQGASMIRLDAVPYLWKRVGTSCAHLPETHELIKLIRDVLDAAAPHVLLLTETNVPHEENVSYVGEAGDEAQMIYNFSLPPLIVWSLLEGDASALSRWAAGLRPLGPRATWLNITATHDGIGMRPTEGLLGEEARERLMAMARERGGDVTGRRHPDGSVSPYELNLSYYDAVNDPRSDESEDVRLRRFLLSQALPMGLRGMPGIYLHSLLGSRNDAEGVRRTGRARSINRERLRVEPLERELAQPAHRRARVLAGVLDLLRRRAELPAFHPDAEQEVLELDPRVFAVRRRSENPPQTVYALHNVSGDPVTVNLPEAGRDVLSDQAWAAGPVPLEGYAVRWLVLDAG